MTETTNTKGGWRIARRIVLVLAIFVTLVALFYAEEDWRGTRAWDRCKAELEAKGVILDWDAYIPPPVPDDQNFFKAPGINESDWVGRGARDLTKRLAPVTQQSTNPLLVAELTIVASSQAPSANAGDNVLSVDDPAARTKGERLIRGALGPCLTTARLSALVARPFDQIDAAKATIVSDTVTSSKELQALFPKTIESSHVQIEPVNNNSFRVLLNPGPVVASDYIRVTDPFEADFDVIRAALKRPYARLDGDYTQPFAIPIPNFITLRTLAQTLTDRTKCHLLLGQPDKALRDLTLLHDICRITEAKPTGKPMTLLAAMINVAISGLYADTIADGFQLHAWREPQLAAMQEQLEQIDLIPFVAEAFSDERAAETRTFERTPPAVIADQWIGLEGGKTNLWRRLKNPIYSFLTFAPRGWVYRNMALMATTHQDILNGINAANGRVIPARTEAGNDRIRELRSGPYTFLARLALPNYTRAVQTLASKQTKTHEALIACALERYRLAHGEYPESLDALVPQFIPKVPHDVIGGGPLHYRRTDSGGFVLYSVGWNEKDDGGQTALDRENKQDFEDADWVWMPK